MKGDWIQIRSVDIVLLSLLNFVASIVVTWPSYTGPLLESAASPLGVSMNKHQVEMVASMPMLGALLSVLTMKLADVVGRKNIEILCGVITTLSWSLVISARSAVQLIAARFLLGFGCGIHLILVMVYVNEISQPFVRGTMACVPIFMYSLGTLISYIMGWLCTYNFIVYLNLVTCVVFTVAMSFIKETPIYLVTKGKDEDALESLKFYRGASKATVAVYEELEYLKKQRDAVSYKPAAKDETALEKIQLNNEKKEDSDETELSAWRTLFTSKSVQRALVTITSLCMLAIMMGLPALQTYAGQFFAAAVPGLSPHICSLSMAIATVVGNALSVFITDLVPRRVLMLSSCTACALCHIFTWSILRWSWAPAWATPLGALMFACSYTVGAGNLPSVQASESFMPKMKVIVAAICTCSLFFSNFVLISLYPLAVDLLGLDNVFLVFFFVSVALTVICFFIMKETKGVPSEEIQRMYEKGYWFWK